MRLCQLAVVLPVMALIGASAFGDEPGPRAQRPQQYPQPYNQDQYQGQYQDQYQDQYGQYDQQEQLPPPMNPQQQYYCVNNCAAAPMPYPPVVMEPVPLPAPIEPPLVIQPMPLPPPAILPPPVLPPVWGRPVPTPYYRPHRPPYAHRPPYPHRPGQPRPVPYGGGMYRQGGPRPMPYQGARVRRMSTEAGCEIQRGNNGEVLVLSKDDKVLYQDKSVHAEANARAMKAYYEGSDFEFCVETEVVPRSESSIEI